MHVLYIHQYFATRKGMTGTRSYEFSRYLVQKGHRVTMITSGLANRRFSVPKGNKYAKFKTDGIDVVAISAGYNDPAVGTGLTGLQRMIKFYHFAFLAGRIGKELARPDVVFATHTPLPVGLAGISLSRYFKVPFVFEVRDLWPEGLVDLGLLKNPLAIWWLSRLARKIYKAADHIVALSPGIRDGILKAGISSEKLTVIPNGCDLDLFKSNTDGSFWRDKLGLGRRFTAIYFGAMGKANGLEYIIEAARILAQQGSSHITLVLLGAGGQRAELVRMAANYGLKNVVFAGPVSREGVAEIVAACDVCLTVIKPAKNNTWSPNKMFDALAAGKPVLINVPGYLGEMIENNNCGRYLDPYSPAALADALDELSADEQTCARMGKNSRALAEREFDRQKLAQQLEKILLETQVKNRK